MSQHPFTIPNGSGADVRLDIQDAVQALASDSAGNSAPGTPYQGQQWVDTNTPSGTVWTIYRWSGAAWHAEATWDTTTGIITPATATVAAKIESGTTKFEITSSGGPIIGTVAGSETIRFDTSRRIMTGGEAAPAAGYTAVGSITLPASAAIRADNTLKAWVKHDGAGTISDSFNMSSVGHPATGAYQYNFTNAMATAHFAAAILTTGSGPNNGVTYNGQTTTYLQIVVGAPYMPVQQDQSCLGLFAGG